MCDYRMSLFSLNLYIETDRYMKAIAVFLLFIGMFMVVQGYYSQAATCHPERVQVKYIYRSLYDEQLPPDPQDADDKPLTRQFKSMFEGIDPLSSATVDTIKKQHIRMS